MANNLITPAVIAKEAMRQLENELTFTKLVNRQYKHEFDKRVGDTISIRRPVKFETNTGFDITSQIQDVEEGVDNLKLQYERNVSWAFSSRDLTLTVDEYSDRYIRPAMITMAQSVDQLGMLLYRDIPNEVGTRNTPPSNFAAMAAAAQRLEELSIKGDINAIVDSAARWAMGSSNSALYMQDVARDAFRKGDLGEIASARVFSSQNVLKHTPGAATGTPLINGVSQNVTYAAAGVTLTDGRVFKSAQSLVTDGWTNSTTGILKAGDVFTIAGVFAVNQVPGDAVLNKSVLSFLQQFTVLEDANSGATTGPATLKIAPAIIIDGPQQTVSAAPADNAAITVRNSAGMMNLMFSPEAFTLVTVPLALPDSATWKQRVTHNGLSMTIMKGMDILTRREIVRVDMLFGWRTTNPMAAVRLAG
ncbi:MAG: hypothetical protein OEW11_11275 [Nitrospirota bacterium]|nr:hypothetical protein [Nitrospirota bacterium]